MLESVFSISELCFFTEILDAEQKIKAISNYFRGREGWSLTEDIFLAKDRLFSIQRCLPGVTSELYLVFSLVGLGFLSFVFILVGCFLMQDVCTDCTMNTI